MKQILPLISMAGLAGAVLFGFGCGRIYTPDPARIVSGSSLIIRVEPINLAQQEFRVVEVLKMVSGEGRSCKVGDIVHLSPPSGTPASLSPKERLVFLGKRNPHNDLYEQRSYMECEVTDSGVEALSGIGLVELRTLIERSSKSGDQ